MKKIYWKNSYHIKTQWSVMQDGTHSILAFSRELQYTNQLSSLAEHSSVIKTLILSNAWYNEYLTFSQCSAVIIPSTKPQDWQLPSSAAKRHIHIWNWSNTSLANAHKYYINFNYKLHSECLKLKKERELESSANTLTRRKRHWKILILIRF